MASVNDDGTLTLRLRMPDGLAGRHGKYLVVPNVRFAYWTRAGAGGVGEQCTSTRPYRREHGEKAARATALGQAISYRFKRDSKGLAGIRHHGIAGGGGYDRPAAWSIGVDLNADHLAVAETNGEWQLRECLAGAAGDLWQEHHQAEALIGDAVAGVVQYAREVGKPIVIENLDFRQKKAAAGGRVP